MKKQILLPTSILFSIACYSQSIFQFNPTKGNALERYETLKKDSLAYEKENADYYYNMHATILSYLCDYDEAQRSFDRRYKDTNIFGKNELDTSLFNKKNYSSINARAEILRLSKSKNILLLNDIHHYHYPRVLLYSLLEGLRKNGYKYLALEDLVIKDSLINSRKYPIYGITGAYSNEPIYAEVIRKACELGFTLISYDYGWKDYNKRFSTSCANVVNRLKGVDLSKDKLVIFGGYGNINENTENRMGFLLKKAFNQDVLSVKCNLYVPHSERVENGEYRYLTNEFRESYPFVLKSRKNDTYLSDSTVDMAVIFPKAYSEKVYSILNYKKMTFYIPDSLRSKAFYFAVADIAEVNGVPLYQGLIDRQAKEITYYVPLNKKYFICLKDEDGNELLRKTEEGIYLCIDE